MSEFDAFFASVWRPITEATVLGAVIAGIVISLVYWRHIRVQMYNGIIFNALFFLAVYVARRTIDGIETAGVYFGIFLLYLLFIYSAWLTHKVVEKYQYSKLKRGH